MPRPGVSVSETVLATPVAAQAPVAAAGALAAPLPSGPTSPILVNSWYAFSRLFGNLNRDYPATFHANMFFRAGGRELYVSRVVKSDAAAASVNLTAQGGSATYITFTAKAKGSYGNSLRIQVSKNSANLYDISVLQEVGGVSGSADDDIVLETFTNLSLGTFNSQEVIDVLAVQSQFVNASWPSNPASTPVIPSTFSLLPLTSGSDGTTGTLDYATAITALKQVNRTFVIMGAGTYDTTTVSALKAFAEETKSFAVLDTAAGLTPAQAVTYAGTVGTSTYCGVYYPHLWVPDPTSQSRDAIVKVAPSGAVAGLILGTDATTGVFKAPAGVDANLPGVVALERSLSASELDTLNSDSSPVNAIRIIPGLGAAVMGGRTLDQAASTRYVNIRRSLSFLDAEMRRRLEFAIFRNNDPVLWNQIRTTLDSFLRGFFLAGGLRGNTTDQAYYVKCDAENNSFSDVANGIVNVEVGVSLQYPAEFIKVKLTQKTLS